MVHKKAEQKHHFKNPNITWIKTWTIIQDRIIYMYMYNRHLEEYFKADSFHWTQHLLHLNTETQTNVLIKLATFQSKIDVSKQYRIKALDRPGECRSPPHFKLSTRP